MKIIISLFSLLLICCSLNSQVVINEFSAANSTEDQDNFGEYEDWVELYNTTNGGINLGGYYLSDDLALPLKYQIPAGTFIGANGHLVVWLSSKNLVAGGNVHANFKLTQTRPSEAIVFSDPGGNIIDSNPIDIPNQRNHSTGRTTDGAATWGVLTNPTPGTTNTNVMNTYAETPGFDMQAGFYNNSVTVTVSVTDPNLSVHYTTDGSFPDTGDPLYTAPLTFTTTTALRAVAYSSDPNTPRSFSKTKTYFVNENHTLHVISIVGSNINTLMSGNQIEPRGHFELFNENGVRVSDSYGDFNKHGNDSWAYDQRGIDFITRDQYGYDFAVKNKLYNGKNRTKFQRVIIKAAANDNYPFETGGAHIRDGYIHELSQRAGLDLDERTHIPAVMYVNGAYWGLYEIREKVDDHDFTKFYYNQERDDLQFIKTWGNTYAEYGGNQALNDWNTLQTFIVNNNMAIPANYTSVDNQMNILSLIDYMIINTHVVCKDWLNYNTAWWRGMNPAGTGQKWRYTLWDMDATFGHYINYTGIPNDDPAADPCDNTSPSIDDPEGHTDMLVSLLDNPDFYALYINRYADLNNTYFSCDSMIALLDTMLAEIAPEMPRQIARWGGNMATWQNNVNDLKAFIQTRCTVINGGIDTCYSVDGPHSLTIVVDPPGAGDVQVNTVVPGGYPYVGNYFSGVPLTLTAIPATGNTFVDWTPNNATLNPNNTALSVTFNHSSTDTIIAKFLVNNGCPPLGSAATSTDDICGASNGTATATANGGLPPYNFQWSTAAGGQTTATASGLAAGTYEVTVSDGAACSETVTVVVNASASFNLTNSSVDAVCGSNNGSATVSVQGGMMPITYLWNAAAANQTTPTAINLSAGSYDVSVIDGTGCSIVETVTVGNNSGTLVATTTTTPATCGANNGTATVNPTGGTGGITFVWNTIPAQTTSTAINLASGTYSVTATDTNGCFVVETVSVGATGNISATLNETEATCTVGNDGSITATPAGGTPPYTYSWSANANGQTGQTIINLTPGIYTVLVTDANGCVTTEAVNLGIVGLLTAQTNSTDASCGVNNGTVTATITQGVGPYMYNWNSIPAQTTATAVGLPSGTYSYTITDNNGCYAFGSETVGAAQGLTVTMQATDNQCSANGASASALVAGGTPPFTYVWSNGATMQTVGGLSTGTYNVTVTDINGCDEVQSISVTSNANGPQLGATHTNISCAGNNDGAIDITVNSGTAPYTYDWGGGITSEDRQGLPPGLYSVLVTDANGCLAVTSVQVSEPAQMVLTPFATPSNGTNGTAAVNVNGGVPPFTYQWSDGQTSQVANNLAAGTYSVIVVDANGCTVQGTVVVPMNTAVESLESLTLFEIYPNPNNGLFNVNLEFNQSENIELQVISALGQVLRVYNNTGTLLSVPVDIQAFPIGVYSIHVRVDDGAMTKQFIKIE